MNNLGRKSPLFAEIFNFIVVRFEVENIVP